MRKHQRERLKQQAPLPFTVESLSHECRGIAHYQDIAEHPEGKAGKTVFVSLALPQEKVLAKVTSTQSRFDEADAVEILEASPERVTPPCPHFGMCGGCSLQHWSTSGQIHFKQKVLAELLQHAGQITPQEWLPPLLNNRTDYRRKARLGVRYVIKKQDVLIGFRERKSSFLADINSCKVLDAQIGERLQDLRALVASLQAKDDIPQLEIAIGDDQLAIIVRHMKPLSDEDTQKILQFAQPLNWQVYLQPEGYDSVHRIDNPNAPMRLHYNIPQYNLRYAFSPLDFTQVNIDINRQMINLACELLELKQGERVLDLFCGLGNFTLPLARCVGSTGYVVGVEGSCDMADRGFENAKLNNIEHVAFYAQDLTKDFSQQPWAQQGFDALLIDPPRSGALEVMQYLPKFNAKRVVYVSCNPATLARDAQVLQSHGYILKKAGVMDMFTHTSHVESIALFVKQ